MTPVTDEEFWALIEGFTATHDHVETQPAYALTYEQADLDAFLAWDAAGRPAGGGPPSPEQTGWWRAWLDTAAALSARPGAAMRRFRVLDDPPTGYQRWLLWATPSYEAAGEDVRYLTRADAVRAALPQDRDFWVLDEARVVAGFYEHGVPSGYWLADDAATVARYRRWRDQAAALSSPARQVAAQLAA